MASSKQNQLTVQEPQHSSALMTLISKAAMDPKMDVAKLKELLDVKRQWEEDEARKAYHVAFAAFKAEAPTIIKNKLITDGPLKGKRYADLFAVVDTLIPVLAKHGLSHSWQITKDEKDWIEVTCILTHVQGHHERRSMSGPPDAGGAKNQIQARASAVSYLERYSFLAVVGMTASETDTDGRQPPEEDAPPPPDPWTAKLKAAGQEAAKKGMVAYSSWWGAQSKEFRAQATHTKQHADFKAEASENDPVQHA